MGVPGISSIRRNTTTTKKSSTAAAAANKLTSPSSTPSSSVAGRKWRTYYSRSGTTGSGNTATTTNNSDDTSHASSSVSVDQKQQQEEVEAVMIVDTKSKRSMRLSISNNNNEEEESESVQVNLMSIRNSPIKRKDEHSTLYTVGSSDYLVKDEDDLQSNNNNPELSIPIIDSTQTMLMHHHKHEKEEVTAAAAASEGNNDNNNNNNNNSGKKKSRSLGSMFKKSGNLSPKKKGRGIAGDEEEEEDGDGDGDGADQNGDDKKDDDKKDDDDNGKDKNNKEKQSKGRPPPITIFTPERIQFAKESTLPIHNTTGSSDSESSSSAPSSTDHSPSWTPVSGTEFKVRMGPNYPKNGKKDHSCESLYEVYCVRFFRSGKRTKGGATRIMPLPDIDIDDATSGVSEKESDGDVKGTTNSGDGDDDEGDDNDNNNDTDTGGDDNNIIDGVNKEDEMGDMTRRMSIEDNNKTTKDEQEGAPQPPPASIKHHPELDGTKVPDILVVHFMLPYEPPNMFKQKDDGPGGECVYYLKPSQRFLDEISGRRTPCTPATSLFVKWCEECESNSQMRSRFKCMALVRDIDKHNFGLLKSYNGKPVLITESGRASSGHHGNVRYLEMTANVHYWAFMAKKGFVSLIPKFANMQMEVGFTIEAHADSEMYHQFNIMKARKSYK